MNRQCAIVSSMPITHLADLRMRLINAIIWRPGDRRAQLAHLPSYGQQLGRYFEIILLAVLLAVHFYFAAHLVAVGGIT